MNNDILYLLIKKYGLSVKDYDYLKKIIEPIYSHYEFQKRLTNEYLHHSDITLGKHILEDTVVTYILGSRYAKKHAINIELAIKISMLHDLYTIPWQNNDLAKVHKFFNKHGFRHPLEAAINAINWYPEIFNNQEESKIIVDGIIHHMFPLPVRRLNINKITKTELKNEEMFNKLSNEKKKIILESVNRKRIGPVSFSRSKYKEGRIMSKADKKVARKEIKNFASAKALLTGKNKKIRKGD